MVAEKTLAHTVGGRILALRDDRDVSQLELAKAVEISTSALRNIEQGKALPRLATLEMLSNYFNVSMDYLVRGVETRNDNYSNMDIYNATGLNDMSIAFMQEQIDLGANVGGLNEYIATLNALMTEGFLPLVWTLNKLNRELAEIEAEIKKALEGEKEPENLVEKMLLNNKLEPLHERRDLLKSRYMRQVNNVFLKLILKGDED